MISVRGKLADHVRDHVVLSPGGRACFGDLPGDRIIVSPPSPIVEQLELEQGTASLTGEEFTMLGRMIMETRGRAAAHVVVAPIDTAQPCNPQSSCSEIPFDVHVYMEANTQDRMDPEPGQLESSSAGTGQLESPSAGTGFETPGQQCLPN